MHDSEQIRELLERLHEALSWPEGSVADWPTFRACFSSVARLYPSGRPLVALSVDEFIERMESQHRAGDLISYEEKLLSTQIEVLGNVAVAYGISQAIMNGTERVRSPNTALAARDGGKWVLAALAWDKETENGGAKSTLGCP